MKIIFVRHGEPDYTLCEERGFIGHGIDMAPLSEKGVNQAKAAAKDPLLSGAEIIIASPYTRALQTAAIISKETGLDIKIEMDLHEWVPDLTFQDKTQKEIHDLLDDFMKCRGVYGEDGDKRWESIQMLSSRVKKCLLKYLNYEKIIVAAHGGVICRVTGSRDMSYCEVKEFDFTEDSIFNGWVD